MLAAAIAAIGFLPARARLTAFATRFVYGAREAPDEALRTFGSRMTRAVAMDELLLQLAESLRKTMGLTAPRSTPAPATCWSARCRSPTRAAIDRADRPRAAHRGPGRGVGQRVGLGLAARAAGRARAGPAPGGAGQPRGELLGLIVVERPARADAFTDEDDRVLTELARQAGLAFHNAQLDSALQTTLDALRKQAEELRESRARIVASGDAERRRVERDLHDGAQQHLVALAINLRLAQDIVADDPAGGGRDARPAGR